MKTCFSPCPPGYMQRKALPSSSACTRPAGVSSPPHFNTSSKDGPSLRVSGNSQHEFSYAGLAAMFGNRIDISYLPPHLRFWAAHGASMWAALSCWSQRSGHTFIRKMKSKNKGKNIKKKNSSPTSDSGSAHWTQWKHLQFKTLFAYFISQNITESST